MALIAGVLIALSSHAQEHASLHLCTFQLHLCLYSDRTGASQVARCSSWGAVAQRQRCSVAEHIAVAPWAVRDAVVEGYGLWPRGN